MVPKAVSTASKNIFIFFPIPSDSRLTDGVLNGFSFSSLAFSALYLVLSGSLRGGFALSSSARAENLEMYT